MTVDEALDFLRSHPRAVLATTRADSAPQLSPVLVAVDDSARVVISTREATAKVANLRRRPRAWICGFTDRFFGPWIQVEGTVEILTLPDAMEPLVNLYRRLSGEHPDWDDYRDAMHREGRVLLAMTVDRAGPATAG